MKQIVVLLLSLLMIGCIPRPALQWIEKIAEQVVEPTKSVKPEPSYTATTVPIPTATLTLLSPTRTSTCTLTPSSASASPTPTPVVYVVQVGDTLGKIAARYRVSVEAISAENGITDVNRLEVGKERILFHSYPAPYHTYESGTWNQQ